MRLIQRLSLTLGISLAGLIPPAAGFAQNDVAVQAAMADDQARAQFCRIAQEDYQVLLNEPLGAEHRSPTDTITFTIYRNSAAERLVTMAWAERCDLAYFLQAETHHLQALSPHTLGASDNNFNVR